jgi:hypothetical protein
MKKILNSSFRKLPPFLNQLRRPTKSTFCVYKNVQKIENLFSLLNTEDDFTNASTDYTKTLNKISLAIYKAMMAEYDKSVQSYTQAEEHKLHIDRILDKWDFTLEENIDKNDFVLSRNSGPFLFKLRIKALDLGNRNLLVKKINDYLVII